MSSVARTVLTLELLVALVSMVAFAIEHTRNAWHETRAGRQLMWMSIVVSVELVVLLGLLHRIHWPEWVLIAVYGAVAVTSARWYLLLRRAHREEKKHDTAQGT